MIEPCIYIKLGEGEQERSAMPEINFPNFLVNAIRIEDAKVQIETPDTLIYQEIDNFEFSYSGRKDGAILEIKDFQLKNDELGIKIYDLSSEVVFKNDIAKLRNLNFMFNDSRISSNGKIRYIEHSRFHFSFNIELISLAVN